MEGFLARKGVQPLTKAVLRGVPAMSALLLVLFCLAAGIPVTGGDGARATQQAGDWKALEQRWSALIAQRRQPDNVKWTSLETDLRAFAKKYDLHLEEHAKKAKPSPSGAPLEAAFAECPARDDVPGYRGYLFPGPKGVCRYVRVPNEKK
jgi:hypothetical protein